MASNNLPQTPTKEDGQGNTAGPPAPSSVTSGSKTDRSVKVRMEDHHIYRNSNASYHPNNTFHHPNNSEFKEHILSQIAPERASAVKPVEIPDLEEAYELCVQLGVSEATFKREMLDLIIKKEFQVLVEPGDDSQGLPPVYESRKIRKGGIFQVTEQPLRRDFLPHTYPTSKFSKKQIAENLKADGMANSVPDSTWGYLARALDLIPQGAKIQSHTRELLNICPGLLCPFFFIEVKTDKGTMEQCRNQAARGCATIVNAMRLLLRMLGREDTIGPDKNSYIYCATLGDEVMEWWVGWAEVHDGKHVSWHMDCLRREHFDGDSPLLEMRRYTHNVLEWGMTTRLPIIKKLVSDLFANDTMLLADDENMGPPDSPSPAKKLKETYSTGSGMKG